MEGPGCALSPTAADKFDSLRTLCSTRSRRAVCCWQAGSGKTTLIKRLQLRTGMGRLAADAAALTGCNSVLRPAEPLTGSDPRAWLAAQWETIVPTAALCAAV